MITNNTPIHKNTLILGGARSGKSSHAEQLAKESGKEVVYIATAKVLDDEIAARVKHHQADRPNNWLTVEEPLDLADCLQHWASPERILLVDCLTMWVTNLLSEDNETQMHDQLDKLVTQLPDYSGSIIFVSNEVGMGIIPMGELTRKFVDEAGRLHQQLAQQVNTVILMVAGLPHVIKDK